MKILIMGATGSAGGNTIPFLLEKGIRPIAAVRNIEKAKEKFGNTVDYVHFDYLDTSTWDNALNGVDRLFTIAPPPKKDPEVFQELMQAAKKAGVQLVVFQSGRTTGTYKGKALYQIEENLHNGDVNYCIVRPGLYMQNFHSWMGATLKDGEIYLPVGDAKMAMTDIIDQGAAIAAILTTDGHDRKTYNITSEEALDCSRMADIFSGAMGRKVTYPNPDDDTFVNRMVEKGWDAEMAKYVVWLFDRAKKGAEAEATPDFKNIVGRHPISFAEFAKREFGA